MLDNLMKELNRVVIVERRLPWRVKRVLTHTYYIRGLTQYAFRFVTKTKPISSCNHSEYEVSTLLDRGNIPSYLLAIKSFFLHSPVPCKISVVSDGSLGAEERSILSRHIEGVNIYEPFEIGEDRDDELSLAMRHARVAYPTIRKTYDIFHSMSSEKIIFLDSDVLFIQPLDKSIFEVNERARMIYNRDHDHSVRDPLFHLSEEFIGQKGLKIHKRITDLNCGFMVFSSKVFDLGLIMEFISHLYRKSRFHTVMEQDAWNIVASTVPVRAMPPRYLVGDNTREYWRRLKSDDLTSIHYVSSVRYHSLHYLRNGMQIMRQLS